MPARDIPVADVWWERVLAWFVPPGLDPERHRQARISAAMLLVSLTVPLLAAAVTPVFTQQPVVLRLIGGIFTSRLVLLALLRWGGLVRLVSQLLIASYFVFLVGVGILAGGAPAPSLMVAPLIPLLSTLLLSLRGGAAWAVATIAATCCFTWIDMAPVAAALRPAAAELDWLGTAPRGALAFHGVAGTFGAVFAWVAAALYEQDRLRRLRALDTARAEAEAATRAKSRFLANMSHEIRTPMSGVLGVADLLATTELTEEQAQLVATLQSSGKGMVALLNDILDMSRLEAGKISLELEPVDLRLLIADVVRVVATTVDGERVAVEACIEPSLPAAVVTDELRLRQVLTNLMANAAKFTPRGHIRLHASAAETSPGEQELVLAVEDTGIGMTPEALEQVLHAFEQADPSTTRRFGGTGLGLTICQHLARALGGALTLRSSPGVGTTAEVRLRAQPAPTPAPAPEPERPALRPGRVLLVEDDPVSRQVAQAMLEHLGAVVVTAADGAAALELVPAGGFDLVFMDVHMPGLDGLEVTRRLRADGHTELPIIALTASAFAEDRAACLEAGMSGHVSKPARFDMLAKVLADHGLACTAETCPERAET